MDAVMTAPDTTAARTPDTMAQNAADLVLAGIDPLFGITGFKANNQKAQDALVLFLNANQIQNGPLKGDATTHLFWAGTHEEWMSVGQAMVDQGFTLVDRYGKTWAEFALEDAALRVTQADATNSPLIGDGDMTDAEIDAEVEALITELDAKEAAGESIVTQEEAAAALEDSVQMTTVVSDEPIIVVGADEGPINAVAPEDTK